MSEEKKPSNKPSLMNWIIWWYMPKIEVCIVFVLLVVAGLWAIMVAPAYYGVGMAIVISLIIVALLVIVIYKFFRNIRKI